MTGIEGRSYAIIGKSGRPAGTGASLEDSALQWPPLGFGRTEADNIPIDEGL
jgi:hypothetical protein